MAESTRKKQDIYLLGQLLKTAILGNKLPAKKVLPIWQRARIPTTQEYNAIKKLDDMFKLWQGLKKHSKRNSDAQRRQEQAFVHSRKDMFDIAHANAIELIQIQEDREFLLAQREPGRRGYMSGVDKNLALKEARSYERKRRQENFKLKSAQAQEEITAGDCSAEIEHSSSDSSSECESEEDSIAKRVQVKRSRKSFDVPSTLCNLLSAARHDLQLVKKIQQFRDVDREVSVAAANALSRHLWYVSEELVGAAFFDDQISHEEKVLMVDALSVESKTTNDFTKRVQMNVNDISDEMSVKDFVSSNTMQFFAILGLPDSFLNKRPSEWREDEQYKKAFEVVSGIKPVNDFAERGVALMQDFNRAIESSEEQKQYLLQVVEYHRTQRKRH
ncbi:hypothetical protein HELRODRAFT_160824 [Helobdella robusta]|uniref:Uncharacterized protein n=1 Tax=Helobdella robusta TaxID=6412 RepID=T1EQS2_HELRO|nr:hypothetical protein HELRODRAFT_160824 [Helobdella robusta]ESO06635.1 hypothetical protein HELRODRAFT_160824 [Helobdella robusta]